MRKLLSVLCLLGFVAAAVAQTRSFSDNESKTFIIGLDSYFYGVSGTLDFEAAGRKSEASLSDGTVAVNGVVLEEGLQNTVIGVHDFTGNHVPELVIARQSATAVWATVYVYTPDGWILIGKVGSENASEIRVFRQVLSIRLPSAMISWTWHGSQFDFKSSDGSPEPAVPCLH